MGMLTDPDFKKSNRDSFDGFFSGAKIGFDPIGQFYSYLTNMRTFGGDGLFDMIIKERKRDTGWIFGSG